MEFIAACIEQLDLAASQLKTGTPSYSRFALILTDNIVELMLHKQCENAIRWDRRKWNRTPKYSLKEKRAALGQYFDEKVKFVKGLKELNADEADFISNAHSYRNELYHAGIRQDPIISPLAWHYHELACDLFGRFPLISYPFASTIRNSEVTARYFPIEEYDYPVTPERVAETARALAKTKPPLESNFVMLLSQYLSGRLDDLENSLDFL